MMKAVPRARWAIEWQRDDARLQLIEPTAAEVADAAPVLASFYNEPHNRRLLANTIELTASDVVDVYRDLEAADGHAFLLLRDGVVAGDADLRRVAAAGGTAEFALLIGDRALQGQGLGTHFAVMAHALAFATFKLQRLYIAIVADNAGSKRLFEKLGYQRDDTPAARAGADAPTDVTLSCPRARFEALWGAAIDGLNIVRRG
jgi:RimJ/RimL family protein N-acetyltransferase